MAKKIISTVWEYILGPGASFSKIFWSAEISATLGRFLKFWLLGTYFGQNGQNWNPSISANFWWNCMRPRYVGDGKVYFHIRNTNLARNFCLAQKFLSKIRILKKFQFYLSESLKSKFLQYGENSTQTWNFKYIFKTYFGLIKNYQ